MRASSHLCSGSRERHRSLPLLLGQQDREKRGVRECPTGPLLKAQGRQAAGSQRPKGPCSQQHTAAQTAAAVLPGSQWAPSWCASCTGPSPPRPHACTPTPLAESADESSAWPSSLVLTAESQSQVRIRGDVSFSTNTRSNGLERRPGQMGWRRLDGSRKESVKGDN